MVQGLKGLAPHKNWKARAADYRALADHTKDPELRGVLEHLTQVCREMAKASVPGSGDGARADDDLWIHPKEVVREATAERWRVREAEYRAIAANCTSADGRDSWRVLADRCRTLAWYLEGARRLAREEA
jgi:hypothetical protein